MYGDSELALQRLLEEPSVFGWVTVSMMEAVGENSIGAARRWGIRLVLDNPPKDGKQAALELVELSRKIRWSTTQPSLLSRDETGHLGSHQPLPPIAAGCRNTGKVWGEGSLVPGDGPPVWYWQPERMCLEGGWKGAGGRERRGPCKERKPPLTSPTDNFLTDEFFFIDIVDFQCYVSF